MPAEAQRLTRVVGRRDRLVIAVVSIGTAVVLGSALAVAELTHRSTTTATGCVQFAEAGVLGGGAWHVCGDAAVRLCASRPTSTPAVQRQCARLENTAAARS